MSAFTPLPPDQQPPWLAQLFQVITVYPPDPEGGSPFGAALCRWCDLTWPLPLAELEGDPLARAAWVMGVAEHGMQHAVDGDLRLDAGGEPMEPVEEEAAG